MTNYEEINALKKEIKEKQERLRALEQAKIVFGRASYEVDAGIPIVKIDPVIGESQRSKRTIIKGYHNINVLDAFDQILFDLMELRKSIPDDSAP